MTPPIVPPSPMQGATSALHEIQGQIEGIGHQLEFLGKERANLYERLRSATGDDRQFMQQRIISVDGNIAGLQGQLSELVGKLAQMEAEQAMGNTLVPPPMPPEFGRQWPVSPDAMTAVFVIFCIGVIVPLSVGLTRRLWRRPAPVAPAPDVEPVSKARFDRLEQAVDAIAIEIERISEGQRFVTRVLSERPTHVRSAASAADANDAALGEAKPFLALGAGPVEAIPIATRQGVKQSITPH
jgi:hypothetical protein